MIDVSLPQIDVVIRALGLGLLHSLWQCTLIGAAAWLALRALRNASPQARYAVACTALAACVLWPAAEVLKQLSIAAPAFDTAATASSPRDIASTFAAVVGVDQRAGALSMLEAALPWLVAAWAAGAVLMLLRLLGGLRWVHRLQRDARDCDDKVWQTRLDRLAQRFGLSGVRLAVFEDSGGPLSTGIWRPMVLVPTALFARMPVEMLEALLAHELAHIRRHDYLANLLQRAAEALLFHHPVVWWLSHRIRHEREQAADHLAAAVICEPRRLALALYELDRFSSEQSFSPIPTLAQAAHGGHLMSRIQSLLRPERRNSPGAIIIPVLGLVMACIACIAYAQSTKAPTQAAVAPKVSVGAFAATGAANTTATTATTAVVTASTSGETYAFVRKDSDKLTMSGKTSDLDEIRQARSHVDGDFLWFRRDGKAYVLRDTATVERMRALWARSASREAQMQALSEQMQAQSSKVEAISSRIEAVASLGGETPRMREAMGKVEALAEQQNTLAHQQAELATTIAIGAAEDKSDTGAEARMEALDAKMEALERQMRALENVIDAEAEKLEASLAPLAAMEKEMQATAAPMEALGAKMEALGAEQEREMTHIDRQIRAEIDRAMDEGLATPAPHGQ